MRARDIIAAIRAGEPVASDALAAFAQGLADHSVSDAQAGAFAMAVCLKGLDDRGRVAFTMAMRDSGRTLSWDGERPVIDKHSTGGVGDCVSLVLAPALAACGARVPMISGRGLGHTGGTLDKLEAIPGFATQLSEAQMRSVLDRAGCCIVGASSDIAPADKRLYAIRDVTATVESLDLITASILSKKLAAGLQSMVLDVKVGSGAFMRDMASAHALARALVKTANAAGCRTTALITDMNQPVAPALGNALEVLESVRVLRGETRGRLFELVASLGGVALADAGLASDVQAGADAIVDAVRTGRAAEAFQAMVAGQGGPVAFVERAERFLPEANVIREISAPEAGIVQAMDARALGECVVALGGGRALETDNVNPSVGLSNVVPIGTEVARGAPLAVVHAVRPKDADQAEAAVRAAIRLGPETVSPAGIVLDRVG